MASEHPGSAPADAFVHRLRVRYGETDQMGRAHHGSFVLYLEDARTRMMAEFGCSYAELERRGFGLVVRSIDLRYREAAHFDEELDVATWVGAQRGASVRIDYAVRRASNGSTVAEGSTHLACVDLRATPPKVEPLPQDVAAALARAPRST
ncbi:MAG: acyl-CoA thioesterase [Planctomycetota bacterium]